jgi:hypothetical protein
MLGRIDLSKVDFQGNKMKTMETANCYIVKKPGKYKIPLIYGNAIKNGKNNILAYASFSDYHDNPIESPWINPDKIDSAEVIWKDERIIDIEDLKFSLGKLYLKFNITGSTKYAGNAVIGIFDVEYNCIWSWHIWYYPDFLEKLQIGYQGKVKKKLPKHYDIGVLSAPLGYDGEGKYLYYQWGRKDPFREDYFRKKWQLRPDEKIITTGIQNPDAFINGLSHSSGNLWDSAAPKSISINQSGIASYFGFTRRSIKTIYDPCPRGFKVPGEDIYHYLDKSSPDIIKHGITFYTLDKGTILLQARGYLGENHSSGEKVSRMDRGGYFWTAHRRTDRASCYCFSSIPPVTSCLTYESISKGFCILPAIDQ